MTDQVLVKHRHAEPLGQLCRDERTLVEAALPLATGPEGYGHERIDVERFGQRLSCDPGSTADRYRLFWNFSRRIASRTGVS